MVTPRSSDSLLTHMLMNVYTAVIIERGENTSQLSCTSSHTESPTLTVCEVLTTYEYDNAVSLKT